jgi:hypothetical protein
MEDMVWTEGDAESLPYPDGSFDVALSQSSSKAASAANLQIPGRPPTPFRVHGLPASVPGRRSAGTGSPPRPCTILAASDRLRLQRILDTRREQIETAVKAGGRYVKEQYEGWIAADPFRGEVQAGRRASSGPCCSLWTKNRSLSPNGSRRRLKSDSIVGSLRDRSKFTNPRGHPRSLLNCNTPLFLN